MLPSTALHVTTGALPPDIAGQQGTPPSKRMHVAANDWLAQHKPLTITDMDGRSESNPVPEHDLAAS